MTATDVRSKALGHLRDRRVIVYRAKTRPGDEGAASTVGALVQSSRPGSNGFYVIDFPDVLHDDGRWACTCGKPESCAHVAAVQMVTGHPSLADR